MAGYRTEDMAKFSLGYHEFESRAHLLWDVNSLLKVQKWYPERMRIGELNVWVLAEMGMAEMAQRGPRQSQEKMACDKSRENTTI